MIDEPIAADGPSVDAASGVENSEPDSVTFPPPGPPVLVSETGIGIERKRREAREQWEREYGSLSRGRNS